LPKKYALLHKLAAAPFPISAAFVTLDGFHDAPRIGANFMPESALPMIPLAVRGQMQRENLPPGDVLCNHCMAKCCRYFALPIDKPKDWEDFDFIRWYLLHDRAAIFTDEGAWYLLVYNPCRHLGDDQLCGIYDTRPQICRDYATANCEYNDDWVYDHYWETPEQIEEYAEAVLGPRDGESIRGKKPK
jgi:Fe-S-cluster containining protein